MIWNGDDYIHRFWSIGALKKQLAGCFVKIALDSFSQCDVYQKKIAVVLHFPTRYRQQCKYCVSPKIIVCSFLLVRISIVSCTFLSAYFLGVTSFWGCADGRHTWHCLPIVLYPAMPCARTYCGLHWCIISKGTHILTFGAKVGIIVGLLSSRDI